MKRISIILAAAAAAAAIFSLASCSKEMSDPTPTTDALKVSISVSGPYETKALKTGWASGDRINVWFDRASNKETHPSQTPDAVLSYDGSSWSCGTIESSVLSELEASGLIYYFYEQTNDLSNYNVTSSNNYHDVDFRTKTDSNGAYIVPMVVSENSSASDSKRAYTYDSAANTLSLNLEAWRFITNIQIVVTNLPASVSPEDCNLQISGFSYTYTRIVPLERVTPNAKYIRCGSGGGEQGSLTRGFANADGVEFHMYAASYSETGKFTFTLFDGTSTKTYTLTSDMSFNTGGSLQSYKLDYTKFQ